MKNTLWKIGVILLLGGAIAGTLALKQGDSHGAADDMAAACCPTPEGAPAFHGESTDPTVAQVMEQPFGPPAPPAVEAPAPGIPRLVDLGADQCIPCKMMAPILADLKRDYAGRMDVEFIDVWKNPDAGERYGVKIIPTQIFYSASGEELRRRTGFIGREDILAIWEELGVSLVAAPEA